MNVHPYASSSVSQGPTGGFPAQKTLAGSLHAGNNWSSYSRFALALILVFLASMPTWAAAASDGTDSDGEQSAESANKKIAQAVSPMVTTKGGFRKQVSRSSFLLQDMWGLREWLSKYGASLSILETSEGLGNASGGYKRGFAYDGLTQGILQVDTQRAFNWYGGTFNVSGLQLHGRNLSADTLGTLQTASGIESDHATRLWELWYDQKFDKTGRLDIKLGQQSLDQEYMVSQNALLFVNTMFGWPMVPSADMPGGGPAYPMSALGGRVHMRPTSAWTLLAGVYNGRPASTSDGDAQKVNASGTQLPLNGGVLLMAEAQYVYPSLGTMVFPGKREPFSRTYKLGAWYDSEKFADQRFDTNGLSLANPLSNGNARQHRGDYSIYGVADQMFWKDQQDDDRSMSFFMRAMGTPQTDRNQIDFSLNAGITFAEPIRHRDDDTFGIGMGYAHVSSSVSGLDRDTGNFAGSYYPVRSGETYIEATYSYQRTPWWIIQPDFQYVFNPGGGTLNTNSTTGKLVQNEAVLGVRMNFAF